MTFSCEGEAAAVCERYGNFAHINLNAGCPSKKAKKQGFGAELMLDADLVRRIVYEMNRKTSSVKITVKCRLGTDKQHGWDNLTRFIMACKEGGSHEMIIHARLCVLNGLTPAQNRSIPPLDYDMVHRLVGEFPDMKFTLNGGIKSFADADWHLGRLTETDCCSFCPNPVDAVMIGREAYNNPWLLANADSHFFGKKDVWINKWEVLEKYFDYCDTEQSLASFKSSTPNLCKPLHNFFHGCETNKKFKIKFDKLIKERPTASVRSIVEEAMSDVIPDSFMVSV